MTLRPAHSRLVAGLAAGIMIGLFFSGVAYAITANVFRYSSPKTGWYSIHPAALSPDLDSRTFDISYTGAILHAPTTGCFSTGVHLPERAKITGLKVWYAATVAHSATFWLFRNNMNTGAATLILLQPSSNTSGDRVGKSYPVSGQTVVNEVYEYGFAVCLSDAATTFRGARISYTYTGAGD